jgi:hypothetical protein
MPSTRFTKTNIDTGTLALLQTVAAGKGISVTMLLEQIIVKYLMYDGRN